MLKNLIDWLSKLPANPAFLVLLGAVVGGIFTLFGGYFGSRVMINDERQRLRREFIGALHVTRSDLGHNASTLQWKLDHNEALTLQLSDRDFRSVQSVLAQNLPPRLFIWLTVINDQMMRMQDVIDNTNHREAPLSASDINELRTLHGALLRAVALVVRYLRETLKSPVEEYEDWPEHPADMADRVEVEVFPGPVTTRETSHPS